MDSEAVAAPGAAYEVGGQRFDAGSAGFAEAIAWAHTHHYRPLCLCQQPGLPMYVARLAGTNGGYIVKRMPDTGSQHAANCPSYEPPADHSGLGQVLGSAITEDPATGETTLKLDFALSKLPGRSILPPTEGDHDSVSTSGTRLSLRGLLHYLWDQAELTRWHLGFAGRRNWAIVRKHLLLAAQNKFMRGAPLLPRLYIPEPFAVEQRDSINQRRLAQWAGATAVPGKPSQLLLLIGEVKEIVPARYGYKAVVKHVPDQAFALDEPLFRRMSRRFEAELYLWGASDRLRMLMVATFGINAGGLPSIVELSLMPVTEQWLPVEDAFELDLIEHLTHQGRSFIKGLRYNLPPGKTLAAATLTDTGDSHPLPMFIVRRKDEVQPGAQEPSDGQGAYEPACGPHWAWQVWEGAMPPLPRPSHPPATTD